MFSRTYAAFNFEPSCAEKLTDVGNAIKEAQSIALNAHDLTSKSLNGQITSAAEEKRIAENYSPWFGDVMSLDAQGNRQSSGQ